MYKIFIQNLDIKKVDQKCTPFLRVLQRNFQGCIDAAQRGLEPAHRVRHNEANGVTPDIPDSRDLGYLVREMANSIQIFSYEMARLSGTV